MSSPFSPKPLSTYGLDSMGTSNQLEKYKIYKVGEGHNINSLKPYWISYSLIVVLIGNKPPQGLYLYLEHITYRSTRVDHGPVAV